MLKENGAWKVARLSPIGCNMRQSSHWACHGQMQDVCACVKVYWQYVCSVKPPELPQMNGTTENINNYVSLGKFFPVF